LSFLRKQGDPEILVIFNLSNRELHVTIDLPVMDYYAVENLLSPKTWRQASLCRSRAVAHSAALQGRQHAGQNEKHAHPLRYRGAPKTLTIEYRKDAIS
jgi:hypothetical protein